MRRALVLAALGLALVWLGSAQHHETASHKTGEEHGAGETGGSLEWWKWANFALLAGGLGWLAKKNAGPFFEARSREIRRQLVEAEEARAEADRRTLEVEARLANLGAEIEALRKEALAEQQAEMERSRDEAAAEIAKLQAMAQQEIAAAGKHARLELKRYAAKLALEAAQVRIGERMTPAVERTLVDSFVRDLEGPSTRAQVM